MPPTTASLPRRPARLSATLLTGALLIGGFVPAEAAAGPSATTATATAVRVNQVGYLPDGPKRATVVTTAAQALGRQVRNASGAVVTSGSTVPRGADTPSGRSVQVADFSSHRTAGAGYVLTGTGIRQHRRRAYGDTRVTDEFYWAAAELYAATGESAYRDAVTSSSWHTSADAFSPYGFGWADTAALGRLVLATVPNGLPAADTARIRTSVTAAADGYLSRLAAQGYAVPVPADGYFWGSNGAVANDAIVMAVAGELTGDARYRAGALETMDYLLGRNALGVSYVTGHGETSSQNQHRRFRAHQLDASLPHPPAGSLAGGPNSALQDPVALETLRGCAPAACYVDHIDSYSTNEVAVYWNAPPARLAAYAAERTAAGGEPPTASCTVTYAVSNVWSTGSTANITVKSTGPTAVDGWQLAWTYPAGQRVTSSWNATVTQSGTAVSARHTDWNRTIASGATVSFGVQGTHTGSTPSPTAFTLNAGACA
ncbi:glycoside hydrolase family 9 protein [Streptomyces sp. NPDC085466]|uniref:glycoside hydrolase family 9 protein n=1 Tax=Streptomyces sp. NPDC085466 TaxID=3365725 RepID=UPI0037D385A8